MQTTVSVTKRIHEFRMYRCGSFLAVNFQLVLLNNIGLGSPLFFSIYSVPKYESFGWFKFQRTDNICISA